MKERVTLTKKEQKRLTVLSHVMVGELSRKQAAEILDLSIRQVKRLLASYRKEGAQALAHGNRGRKPKHAVDGGMKERVSALASSTYAGVNTQHFTELLAKHAPIIPPELFEATQQAQARRRALPTTIPGKGHRYSLSGMRGVQLAVAGSVYQIVITPGLYTLIVRIGVTAPQRVQHYCNLRIKWRPTFKPSSCQQIIESKCWPTAAIWKLTKVWKLRLKDILLQHISSLRKVHRLIDMVNANGGKDNITAILLKADQPCSQLNMRSV